MPCFETRRNVFLLCSRIRSNVFLLFFECVDQMFALRLVYLMTIFNIELSISLRDQHIVDSLRAIEIDQIIKIVNRLWNKMCRIVRDIVIADRRATWTLIFSESKQNDQHDLACDCCLLRSLSESHEWTSRRCCRIQLSQSFDQSLMFTYRDYLQSKEDAVIVFKPALVKDLFIHVENLEIEKQLSVTTFSSGKRIAQALMSEGMKSLMSRRTWWREKLDESSMSWWAWWGGKLDE